MSVITYRIKPDTGAQQVAWTMAGALIFGIAAIYFGHSDSSKAIWHSLMWAGAWSSVGWFLGFLFGIPRFLSTDTARTPDAVGLEGATKTLEEADAAAKRLREVANKAAQDKIAANAGTDESAKADMVSTEKTAREAADRAEIEVSDAKQRLAELRPKGSKAAGSSLSVNTNLEQISDWLTKIIVGVSLVEADTLLIKMQAAAAFMAKSMGNAEDSAPAESLALALLVYFLATGLLGSYLLTRLFLQEALNRAATDGAVPN
ncbi:hypothetical protein KAK06_02960 [Ideonella sp. 4Y11]|uniref:Uncharacterized protein n=1 Tax=Ideonella aquatica TaxID=2824119 RepID=A0A940YR44_9BURK|nr:hypothetical protein [Ideonella aquatica]MBQ0957910.1 hypothetical protein [Ideonella aquatica]